MISWGGNPQKQGEQMQNYCRIADKIIEVARAKEHTIVDVVLGQVIALKATLASLENSVDSPLEIQNLGTALELVRRGLFECIEYRDNPELSKAN